MKFERYERAVRLAQRIADHFHATPEIYYTQTPCTIISFTAKNFPDFKQTLSDAVRLESSNKNRLNENLWILKICPDDGDLAMLQLNVTKEQAIEEFISNKLGLPVQNKILTESSWTNWSKLTDDEIFNKVSDNITQIMDIYRISTNTAKKVRKEIELQFESFSAWKPEKH